ncbi:MAG: AAA family ATPase [Prevotella sp.]|nr:AAA family ATPase [Prevotella sp.]
MENRHPALHDIYEPEVASTLFRELGDAVAGRTDMHGVYKALEHIFQRCLFMKTGTARLNLGGTFAKTDYLLKEYRAPKSLVTAVNDTRVRLRKAAGQAAHSETVDGLRLEDHYMHDFRNLCEFISFIYKTPVPGQLAAMFPESRREEQSLSLIGEYARVIVERWDDRFIYCQHESSIEGETVRVAYSGGVNGHDWSYLREMLYEGAQLNIIRPREKDGVLIPELIILEPDYLVDISAIARCFTSYAESPLVHLINKIQPQQTTEPIILGNFASQLLDEAMTHRDTGMPPYSRSARDFFKDNALNFLTLGRNHDLHRNAQMQRINIQAALDTLEESLGRFNVNDAIVEPSFFSEMLGLQGRMDYLQLDLKVLMEQKSGKSAFSCNETEIKPREEHYIQLLLYMLIIRYNYREIYERNNRELHALLLYSKYSNGLIELPFAPQLVFRALKVRNGIARADMAYTQPGGFALLETLSADLLNEKNARGTLWERYQKPQLQSLLAPIRDASPLERMYCLRFMTFIANEHAMAKTGNRTKENSGFAAKWHDSLEEKRLAGNIHDGLSLLSPDRETKGKIERVTLRFPETADNDMSNFRTGDIVILYPYAKGEVPDARATMVFRCSIEEIGQETLTLMLRAPQSDSRVFMRHEGMVWAIEHDFFESSYSALYRGMHAFLSAPKERRDLLLLQREPETDGTRRLKGDYGAFNSLSLRVKQAKDIFLIIGPPGTGKTSFGMLNTVREELLEEDTNILLMSYTNRAVDEICSKLHQEGIRFIRIGGRLNCSGDYRDRLLDERVQASESIESLREEIMATRVIVGTTTSLTANIQLLGMKEFSLAVIDEASQILEPHLTGLLSAHRNGVPALRKLVFIGDHKQLPAVVQQRQETSRVEEEALHAIHLTDCRLSLFERLLRRYGGDSRVVYMLTRQGRMHRDIAMFPNHAFYNNRLEVVPCPHQTVTLPFRGKGTDGIDDMLATRRIAFIAVPAPQRSPSEKVNQDEADIIAATVARIYEREREVFSADRTVGVIVPYRNQIATVRNTIAGYGIEALDDITIDTVERYQGSQRRYIVYGFTVQRYHQLDFLSANTFTDTDGSIIDRKLKVAMTRAEEHLVMVGNPALLANNFIFFKLMEFVRSKHGYFHIPKERYVRGDFAVPPYDPEALDLGRAAFGVSEAFGKAFARHVAMPLQEASGEGWPEKVMGADMTANLNAIGYGRTGFSDPTRKEGQDGMTPMQQALVYCHYLMRPQYCLAKEIYASCGERIRCLMAEAEGRVHLIDIGCGASACGVAFAELFRDIAPGMTYTGIEASAEMRDMGKAFIDEICRGALPCRMEGSFETLGKELLEERHGMPSLTVFNFSWFFHNVTAQYAERLALQLADIMARHPQGKFILVVQHYRNDSCLNAYRAFMQVLQTRISVIGRGTATTACTLDGRKHMLSSRYDVLEGRL